MSFLLDTNICSAHLKRPAGLTHRFIQHSGRLYLSTIALGELYTWAHRRASPSRLLDRINDLLTDIQILDYDTVCCEVFGQVHGTLLSQGVVVNRVDLMIGAVAIAHNFTLVTHNTRDFQAIPGLRLDDWLAS